MADLQRLDVVPPQEVNVHTLCTATSLETRKRPRGRHRWIFGGYYTADFIRRHYDPLGSILYFRGPFCPLEGQKHDRGISSRSRLAARASAPA